MDTKSRPIPTKPTSRSGTNRDKGSRTESLVRNYLHGNHLPPLRIRRPAAR
jgi:hypothetical protein